MDMNCCETCFCIHAIGIIYTLAYPAYYNDKSTSKFKIYINYHDLGIESIPPEINTPRNIWKFNMEIFLLNLHTGE